MILKRICSPLNFLLCFNKQLIIILNYFTKLYRNVNVIFELKKMNQINTISKVRGTNLLRYFGALVLMAIDASAFNSEKVK